MYGIAAARQIYRKIKRNPTDMSSSTQITSAPVQPAQQDARPADSQKTPDKPLPRTGSLGDHQGLYRSTRPTWTKSLKADGKKPAAADAAKLAESTSLPQTEEHIAAPRNPPGHIELLDKQDRERYTDLWAKIPTAPEHWKGKRLDQPERMEAIDNIGTRQDLDAKSEGILQSRLSTTQSSEERDKLNEFRKQLVQSKADLYALSRALQQNALYGVAARAA